LRRVAGSADVRVSLPAKRRYLLENLLPTGEIVDVADDHPLDGSLIGARLLDDCFTGFERGMATLEWERLRLTISFDCSNPHAQVYTRPDSICIEPQTCAPDAFNLAARGSISDGMAVVAPGRPLALSMRWTWEIHPEVRA
jgi:galactose mutarotase-like enzyme